MVNNFYDLLNVMVGPNNDSGAKFSNNACGWSKGDINS
jgi:hypothetical protein